MRTITVGRNDAGQRLDKFLFKCLPALPKGMLYKLIRKKDIRRNGARCREMDILQEGDVLTLYVKDEFWEKTPASRSFERAKGVLQVIYEDASLLVVYKPKGMYAHSGNDPKAVTLLDEVQQYLYRKGEYQPEEEQSFAPSLCNRIDRNTEGLVIAAKNAQALRNVNEAIRNRKIFKAYLAVTAAPLPQKTDLCKAWLKKDSRSNMVRITEKPSGEGWQEIRTRYRVLFQRGKKQLVYIELLTGRTHQIRAHLAYLHAPVLGDPKYGKSCGEEENQCLCAYALRFAEPADMEGKTVRAPLPAFVKKYFPDATEDLIDKSG